MFLPKKLIFTGLLFASLSLHAAKSIPADALISQLPNDTIFDIAIPDEFIYTLDHMLSDWHISKSIVSTCDTITHAPVVPDSVIQHRLQQLHCVMELPFNSYVRSFIDLYTVRRRGQLSNLLGLGDYYFEMFEQVLEKNGLPHELKYLPVIESALNPVARSRVGAAGLWQFMLATGRMYGLEVNNYVDERMDPYKSTHAAVKYLKDLYDIYGDWHLVIAAYNCGPGNVNKAIRRTGGTRDYWAIYPHLPRETRGYVPIFIAATYSMEYAAEHQVCKSEVKLPLKADTVMIKQRIHFEQIAHVLDIPVEEIRLMNPQYRRDIVPGDIKPYAVVLPIQMTGKFIDRLDEVVSFKADSLIHNRRTAIEIPGTASSGTGNVIHHRVTSGQTLGGIAARYGVSVARIREWNNIKGSMIRTGQVLKIYK